MFVARYSHCHAYTWDGRGNFFGVYLERRGERYWVRQYWQAQRQGRQTAAEVLAEGAHSLDGDVDTLRLLGGELGKAVWTELSLPPLSGPDLEQAVAFELAKLLPLAPDKLLWGGRWLGGPKGGKFRLCAFSRHDWEQWLAAASGLSGGIDMIVPPAAALDPVLGGRDVCLADGSGEIVESYAPAGDSHVPSFAPPPENRGEVFGSGPAPLACPRLQTGALAALPPEQQQAFAPAVLLAMYGLGRELSRDLRLWPGLPPELRLRRNRGQKIWAVAASLALGLLLSVWLGHWALARNRERAALGEQERELRRRVAALQQALPGGEAARKLQQELQTLVAGRPRLAGTLAELSGILDNSLWATSLSWNQDKLTLTIHSDREKQGLGDLFRQSPWFADVETGMMIDPADKSVTYTVNCRVQPPPAGGTAAASGPDESDWPGAAVHPGTGPGPAAVANGRPVPPQTLPRPAVAQPADLFGGVSPSELRRAGAPDPARVGSPPAILPADTPLPPGVAPAVPVPAVPPANPAAPPPVPTPAGGFEAP